MRNKAGLFLIQLFVCAAVWAQPTQVYYLRANIDEPWCCGWAPYPNANPSGFTDVFGAGGWNLAYYETASAASIFSTNTCYVFLEGGDGHANEMEVFFTTNQTLIENWVYNGGSLFLNAAPNEGNGMSYGFGGVWLWYPYWWAGSVQPAPGMATHAIFLGPHTPITTSYTGTSFTHAYMSGGGITTIIDDAWTPGYPALSYKTWGAGTVFFGGMTTASWHYPQIEAANLRKNMHSYLYGLCALVLPVEFSSFDALPIETTVRLNWTVENELEVESYAIERSADGISWEVIEEINVQDPGAQLGTYTRFDPAPITGLSYYQIKMTYQDGHFGYSSTKTVELNGKLTLFPVPAQDVLYLASEGNAPDALYIWNAKGEAIEIETCFNHGLTALRVADLPAGLYAIKTVSNGVATSRTFIKQ